MLLFKGPKQGCLSADTSSHYLADMLAVICPLPPTRGNPQISQWNRKSQDEWLAVTQQQP